MDAGLDEVLEAVDQYLLRSPEGRTAKERANLLVEVAQLVYDDVKIRNPEGEGLDGQDGPQRRGIGVILGAAKEYQTEVRYRSHTAAAR